MKALKTSVVALGMLLGASLSSVATAQEPPAPGASPRIDSIRKAGKLRVGVLQNMPWLVENTSGTGEPWKGPAWMLAKEWARLLGVQLELVRVSNETKVIAAPTNQADVVVTGLAVSDERLKVVDFINISSTAVCLVGQSNNPNFSRAKTVDELNTSDIRIVYPLGGPDKPWLEKRLPKATLVSFAGGSSGESAIDAVVAGRGDVAILNRVLWPWLQASVKGLSVLPKNCKESTEKAAPIGMTVAKNQTVYVDWMRAVAKRMQPELTAAEDALLANVGK